MTPSDDLSNLWQTLPGHQGDTAALLREVERRARPFDRVIRRRDWRESAAGLLVAILFGWLAVVAHSPIARLADLWLSVYGLWVIFYLRRHSKTAGDSAADRTLAEYRAKVLDGYSLQIRLLKTAKYWYVLPLWIGLMLMACGHFQRTGKLATLLIEGAAFTAMAAILVWVNEGPGVRYIRKQQQEMMAFFGNEREA
jgi:hypothetical protein